jgi:phosphosulfolactate synthase
MRDVLSTILDAMAGPGFLRLPDRASPPRSSGITHVLDTGLPFAALPPVLSALTGLIDVWKFGWGTAYLDPDIEAKTELLREHDIKACSGGTLLEVAWQQGRAAACMDWAEQVGLPCLEVSNGAVRMPVADKRRLIVDAAERFEVLSEVGSKDPALAVDALAWAEEAASDVAAGASRIVTEGRESGTVGLFAADGSVREEVVEALVDAVGLRTLLFEAPAKNQQAWFIRRFGPNVNLGNIRIDNVLGLEAMRCGLRADTVSLLTDSMPDARSALR